MTQRTPYSRVFVIEDRAGPGRVPVYQGITRALGPTWALGDRTPVREPDPNRYGAFKIVDAIKGEKGLPTLSLEAHYASTLSDYLRMARRGCPLDVQVHFGKCQDPRDFNGGWDKILVLEGADFSNWSTSELGALEQGQDAVINETVDLNAYDLYEIMPVLFSELAAATIVGPIIDVSICDAVTCGECGLPSTGCQIVFALEYPQTGSPGLAPQVLFSRDGGVTVGSDWINTLAPTESPSAMACVGKYLVVICAAATSCGLSYVPIEDILNGTSIWTEVLTGFVAAHCPNDIFSLGSGFTWIVGDGGYVYFTNDVTAGVVVQNAGVATVQNLNAIHGCDEDHLVAVGQSNAVIFTNDGGTTWAAITGPAPAVHLNTVWMKSTLEWFIGTAGGNLYYTRDAGLTWTLKTFPGSGAGQVRDIVFATPTVGYMSHSTAAPASRILRTIDGGNSWYVLPEGTGSIPANDYVTALAANGDCPNVVYGGGVAENGLDGFFVKAA